jgi:hypothetical protein
MKVNVEIDCTPQEARAFFGLPDVTLLNAHLIAEIQKRLDANLSMASADELMRNWLAFGGQASEQFVKMMAAASSGLARGKSRG